MAHSQVAAPATTSIEEPNKDYPDELLALRNLIKASTSSIITCKRITTAFSIYQEEYNSSNETTDPHTPVEGDSEFSAASGFILPGARTADAASVAQAALMDAITKLEASLPIDEEITQSPEAQLKKSKATIAVLEAFDALQKVCQWSVPLSRAELELKEAIEALQISSAESKKYQVINTELTEYEKVLAESNREGLDGARNMAQLAVAETKLRKAIKSLENRKDFVRKAFIYTSIALIAAIAMAICYFALPHLAFMSIAMPWILIGAGIFAGANYSYHSYNTNVTLGRGVAILISLATAVLAFVSVSSASIPLTGAIVFAAGCFVANLILYRANVPDALNALTNYAKNLKARWKKTPRLEKLWKIATVAAALVTGLVLTLGMFHSWHLVFAGSILGAPYIFFPLMLVTFIANSAFVYRGLARVVAAFSTSINVFKQGLVVSNKGEYELAKPGTDQTLIKLTGYQAVLYYYLGISPDDTMPIIVAKIIFHTVIKTALVALIVFISQKALVDMNMTAFTEVLPWFHDATLFIIVNIALYTSYGTRMSFVLLDLLNNTSKLTGAFFKKDNYTYLGTKLWQFVNLKWLTYDAIKAAKQWVPDLFAEYMNTVRSYTQDHQVIEVWRAAAKDNWRDLWNSQIKEDWDKATVIEAIYCHIKAISAWTLMIFKGPAILLNTASNGFIAIFNGGNGVGVYSPVPKALMGGAASAALVTVSAEKIETDKRNLLSRQASHSGPRLFSPTAHKPAQTTPSRPTNAGLGDGTVEGVGAVGGEASASHPSSKDRETASTGRNGAVPVASSNGSLLLSA